MCLCCVAMQPWGESVFLQLQKKRDMQWTKGELANKLRKWNESCWKGTVYIIFSTTAFLVTFREPYFLDPRHFWTDCNQFPLNYHVPFKTTLFYLIEIGFYLQVCWWPALPGWQRSRHTTSTCMQTAASLLALGRRPGSRVCRLAGESAACSHANMLLLSSSRAKDSLL